MRVWPVCSSAAPHTEQPCLSDGSIGSPRYCSGCRSASASTADVWGLGTPAGRSGLRQSIDRLALGLLPTVGAADGRALAAECGVGVPERLAACRGARADPGPGHPPPRRVGVTGRRAGSAQGLAPGRNGRLRRSRGVRPRLRSAPALAGPGRRRDPVQRASGGGASGLARRAAPAALPAQQPRRHRVARARRAPRRGQASHLRYACVVAAGRRSTGRKSHHLGRDRARRDVLFRAARPLWRSSANRDRNAARRRRRAGASAPDSSARRERAQARARRPRRDMAWCGSACTVAPRRSSSRSKTTAPASKISGGSKPAVAPDWPISVRGCTRCMATPRHSRRDLPVKVAASASPRACHFRRPSRQARAPAAHAPRRVSSRRLRRRRDTEREGARRSRGR